MHHAAVTLSLMRKHLGVLKLVQMWKGAIKGRDISFCFLQESYGNFYKNGYLNSKHCRFENQGLGCCLPLTQIPCPRTVVLKGLAWRILTIGICLRLTWLFMGEVFMSVSIQEMIALLHHVCTWLDYILYMYVYLHSVAVNVSVSLTHSQPQPTTTTTTTTTTKTHSNSNTRQQYHSYCIAGSSLSSIIRSSISPPPSSTFAVWFDVKCAMSKLTASTLFQEASAMLEDFDLGTALGDPFFSCAFMSHKHDKPRMMS